MKGTSPFADQLGRQILDDDSRYRTSPDIPTCWVRGSPMKDCRAKSGVDREGRVEAVGV